MYSGKQPSQLIGCSATKFNCILMLLYFILYDILYFVSDVSVCCTTENRLKREVNGKWPSKVKERIMVHFGSLDWDISFPSPFKWIRLQYETLLRLGLILRYCSEFASYRVSNMIWLRSWDDFVDKNTNIDKLLWRNKADL